MGAQAFTQKVTPARRQAIARKAALTRWEHTPPAQRSEAARKAVQARWAKARTKKK